MDTEDVFRLAKGPLKVASTISKERRTIELFLRYFRQLPTTRAMLDNLKGDERGKLQTAIADLISYYDYNAKNEEELCFLVRYALTFKQVVDAARKVSESIVPAKAIPSKTCIEALMESYHKWMQETDEL